MLEKYKHCASQVVQCEQHIGERISQLIWKEKLDICHVPQMCILDGNAYDAKCLEAGQERDEDLNACSLLVNNKMQPLLSPSGAAAHNQHSKVVVQLTVRPGSPLNLQFLTLLCLLLFAPKVICATQ